MAAGSNVRISLIGLGRAGGFHLASIRALPGVSLCQVFDTDRARAEAVVAEHGGRVAEALAIAESLNRGVGG